MLQDSEQLLRVTKIKIYGQMTIVYEPLACTRHGDLQISLDEMSPNTPQDEG